MALQIGKVYRAREGVDLTMQYVTGPLLVPFFVLQFGAGSLVPVLMLTYVIWRLFPPREDQVALKAGAA